MEQISQLATPPLLFFRPKESESTWFLQTYPIFFGSLSAYNKNRTMDRIITDIEKVSGPLNKIAEFNRPED